MKCWSVPIGQENTHSYSVTLSQPLWRPGSIRGVRIAVHRRHQPCRQHSDKPGHQQPGHRRVAQRMAPGGRAIPGAQLRWHRF